jgi:hypothetical protein
MFVLLGLLIAVLVGFSSGSTDTGNASRLAPAQLQQAASLRLVSLHPLAVRGANFRAGERVRVTVFSGRKKVRKSVTAPHRTFAASFAASADPCVGALAIAVGNEGSRAVARSMVRACPPPAKLPGRSP